MFKPHRCEITQQTGGFDSNRNPITTETTLLAVDSCFLDQNLPKTTVFTPDGQFVKDSSGVIYFDKNAIQLSNIKIGNFISVFEKGNNRLIYKGAIKSFNEDLFHIRVWV